MATAPEREVLEYRRAMKEKLKKEFHRQQWDPFRHASEDGHIFDPAVQRFMSMRACQYDYFKATPKTSYMGLCSVVPIIIYCYFLKKDRDHLNNTVSTGQVAYKDRRCKF